MSSLLVYQRKRREASSRPSEDRRNFPFGAQPAQAHTDANQQNSGQKRASRIQYRLRLVPFHTPRVEYPLLLRTLSLTSYFRFFSFLFFSESYIIIQRGTAEMVAFDKCETRPGHIDAILNGLDRYNPETTTVFQDYVAQQCEDRTFDCYANLALLKL